MSLIQLIVIVLVLGLLVGLANRYVPPPFAMVVNVLAVVFLCVLLLQVFGIVHLTGIRV